MNKAPWEYLENLSEIFYVIEMETCRLVYMNQYTRKMFGVSESDYIGKSCYSILQGLKEPCPFCTNRALETQPIQEVRESVYRNPILKRTLRIKDVIIEYEGKKYRLEIGLKLRDFQDEVEDSFLIYQETMLNECLMLGCFAINEEDLLSGILEYICMHLECTGCFIYEPDDDGLFRATYGWFDGKKVLPGPLPALQETMEKMGTWYRMLQHNEPLVLYDMEKLYEMDEKAESYFAPFGVKREILFPLMRDGDMSGFLRLDNPPENRVTQIEHFCKLLCHFISLILHRRDMVSTLKQISYYDQLTGAKNRYALSEFTASRQLLEPLGIIFGDINGLKEVNDTRGHECGDQLIREVCQSLMEIFGVGSVYRMGGDEFLVLCSGVSEKEFEEIVEKTRKIPQLTENLSIGSIWKDRGEKDILELVNTADERMYTEKRKYHRDRAAFGTPEIRP